MLNTPPTAEQAASTKLSEINQKAYLNENIVSHYLAEEKLQPAEETIIHQIKHAIEGKRILDIGVGGGRTTPHLLNVSSHYTGVDISAKMIEGCKQRFPGVNFDTCDARDMSRFKDASFDFILFSFNGIDYVSHADRLVILSEIHRLLSPYGYFAFSTHNRNWNKFRHVATSTINPLKLLIYLKRYGVETLTQYLHRDEETHTDEYAITYDMFDGHALMTYCIGIDEQIRQLSRAGFDGALKVYDKDGHEVVQNTHSCWVTYCAQKS